MPEHDDEEVAEATSGRPIWTGSVSFGLVNVPVNVLPAHRPKRVAMRMVSPDGRPLERRYFTTKTDRPLDKDQIVKGYEVKKGKFVVLTDDELERLSPERSRNITVDTFVKIDEVDPMHFERAYFLTPAKGSTDAYRLLAQVLEETERAGIASFVMRSKEYVAAILAENGILRLETLRRPEELRTPKDVGLPKPARPKPTDVRRMATQVRKLNATSISRKEMVDPVAERMLALVAKKARKGEDVVKLSKKEAKQEGVIDLVAILQQRLREAKAGAPTGTAPPRRRKPRKKARGS